MTDYDYYSSESSSSSDDSSLNADLLSILRNTDNNCITNGRRVKPVRRRPVNTTDLEEAFTVNPVSFKSCGKAIMYDYQNLVDVMTKRGVFDTVIDISVYKNDRVITRKSSHPWNVQLRAGRVKCQGTLIEDFKVTF